MEDTDALFPILSDPEVMRFIEPPYTRSQTAAFITDQIRAEVPQAYALTENATGALIGHVIWHPHDSEAYELGWILAREHWGKGYATEITQALFGIAWGELKDVVIQCTPEQTTAANQSAQQPVQQQPQYQQPQGGFSFGWPFGSFFY